MTEKTRTVHMAVAVDWLRGFLLMREREGHSQDIVTRSDGEPVSYAAALEHLAGLEKDGYAFIPSCDDTDETGRCRGHR